MTKLRSRIGVATTVVPSWTEYQGSKVRRPSLHFCNMASHAKILGIHEFSLFSPLSVEWDRDSVSAWVPQNPDKPYGHWIQTRLRSPLVIYENVFVHLALKGYATAMRREARKRGIPVFNPPLPGKWHLHRWLLGTELKRYLPPTERLDEVARAISLTQQWKTTYVKPIGGYGGMGVTRVEHIGNGRYRLSLDRTGDGLCTQVRREVSLSDLTAWLRKQRLRPHLVQQGIRLSTVKGRKIDFRVVVQRDRYGKWQVVGVVPKVAANDGVVTNIIAGGERHDFTSIVRLARREGKTISYSGLRTAALEIANAIGERYPHAGILGFDMGMDDEGRVFMIEMNPKPARSLLNTEMRSLSARYSVEFALYLAELGRKTKMRDIKLSAQQESANLAGWSLLQEDVEWGANMSIHTDHDYDLQKEQPLL